MLTQTPPSHAGRRFDVEPLTPAEVGQLVRSIGSRYSNGVRLRALVGVLYGGGLRLQEALDLVPRDVDLDSGALRVRNGKGGKARVVGLDPSSCALVATWMERRASLGLNGRHPVFATYSANAHGRPLSQRYVRATLADAAARAGLEKRVHPHGLRHSHAFALANEGTPLHVIQQQLGHGSLATTDRYIAHLNPTQVVNTMRARPNWMT